jgi:hypothetical protein
MQTPQIKWNKIRETNFRYTCQCYAISEDFVLLQETLSKIGIMSRMVGNQIREVMSSIAEIQSACQEELSVLAGGGAGDNAG